MKNTIAKITLAASLLAGGIYYAYAFSADDVTVTVAGHDGVTRSDYTMVPDEFWDDVFVWDVDAGNYKMATVDQKWFYVGGGLFNFRENLASSTGNGLLSSSMYTSLQSIIGHISTVGFTGSYNDLTNLPGLSDVALSNSYNDLNNKPTNVTSTSSGFMSTGDKSKLDSISTSTIASIKQTETATATTDASGNYTWTYSHSFPSSPNSVQATAVVGVTTSSFNVQIVSSSATSTIFKVYSTVPTNILGNLLGAAPVATQATLKMVAIQ